MSADPLFLVIGAGSIGKRHIRNLKSLGRNNLLAYDPREDRLQEVAAQLEVAGTSSLDEAFGRQPRVVFVCSPTNLHLEHAIQAARAGAHIFIEKPVAATFEGLDTLIQEVDRQKLKTLVGCNFRFHWGMRLTQHLLASGVAGRVVAARAIFGQYLPDWHPWEDYRATYSARAAAGGGVVLDRIHELDYLCWLLGEWESVTAVTGRVSSLEIDTEDVAEIIVRFRSGAIGTAHVDYLSRSYDCRLELIGEAGTVIWSFHESQVRWYSAADRQWHSQQWPSANTNDMYLDQTRHFLDVLAEKVESTNDVRFASRVLALALAAKRSSQEGQAIKK